MKMRIISILTFILVINFSVSAQMYERTGKNLGLSLYGGTVYHEWESGLTGVNLQISATRSFFNIIFPELGYTIRSTQNTKHFLQGGMKFKIPVWDFPLGKSNHGECTYLNLHVLTGWQYNFLLNNSVGILNSNRDENNLEFGLGLNPSFSGGHKSRVNWSYYLDFLYQYDLNDNEWGYKSHVIAVRLTVLKHQSYDFLNIR